MSGVALARPAWQNWPVRRLILPLFFAIMVPSPLLAQPVGQAGAAACVWRELPPGVRSAMIDAAPDMTKVIRAVSAQQGEAAANACGLASTEETALLTFRSVVGHAMAEGSGAKLRAKYGLTTAQLDSAWLGIPETVRAEMRVSINEGAGLPDSAFDALSALGDGWKIEPEDQLTMLLGYAYGRSMMEAASGLATGLSRL
jgi:hypothetical protein